jgi:hypothetical protein
MFEKKIVIEFHAELSICFMIDNSTFFGNIHLLCDWQFSLCESEYAKVI